MAFVASQLEGVTGKIYGNGHCVALVRDLSGAPFTAQWRRGVRVRDNPSLAPGTAIATFDGDRYGNHTDGRSHAAILLEIKDDGLLVIDQWIGQSAHQRTIRWRGKTGFAVNDGDQFYVIELA